MTPTTDDQGAWLNAASAIIAILWAALAVAYGKLWTSIATREWVMMRIETARKEDEDHDRKLIEDMLRPLSVQIAAFTAEVASVKSELAVLHGQNASSLGVLSGKLDILLSREKP